MTIVNPKARETVGEYQWGFHDDEVPLFRAEKGLGEGVVRQISAIKDEPEWMLEFRLDSLRTFFEKDDPTWAGSPELLDAINFDDMTYYVRATDKDSSNWDDVPEYIKDTFDKLGIPEAERQFLAGAGAQYDSEVVYHNIREDLAKQGVIFLGMDQGLAEHGDLVREYFGSLVPAGDNRYAALNSAVWSGGSFIYVPPGVQVDVPLQAYFRINTENMGQFERTLIIADEGAYLHYVEGCSAPTYSSDSLHSAVVEIIVKKDARVPLHDHPELVEQRLQPGDQARRRLRERRHGVGRRQHRLEADDEVPVRLPDGAGRARRDSLAGVRRRKDSTRTRAARSSTSRRGPPRRSSPSPSRAAAGAPPTAACSRSTRAPRTPPPPCAAMRCCWTSTPAPTPTRRWRSTRRR